MEDVLDAGFFRGAMVGSLQLSHLFYANDALFLGEWSRYNIVGVVRLLHCFFCVPGLKINLHKSNLFGVGVDYMDVSNLAYITRCEPGDILPLLYLGLLVGANMARLKSWDSIIDKFNKRLSR